MAKVHELVFTDHGFKMRKIAETVGISKDLVDIKHEILAMRKLSMRMLSRLVTADN